MTSAYKKRILGENLLILILGLLALTALVLSCFPKAAISVFVMHFLAMKALTTRAFSVMLLVALFNLYQRKRVALYVTWALLTFSLVRRVLEQHPTPFSWVALVLDVVGLLLLWRWRSDFCCRPERRSLKKAALIALLAAAAVLLNATFSYHILRTELSGTPNRVVLWDSLTEALGILFGTTNSNAPGFPNVHFEDFLFWFSWGCLLLALAFSLRPWIERFLWTEKNMERARSIVLKYGQNSSSYLTLEDDKLLYFSRCAEGVLPYGVVGSTVIVNGDAICAPEHYGEVLAEFREYCQKSSHKLVFLSLSPRFLEEFKKQGFGVVKCGEEARFDLARYDLAGKKGAKMRMNINHATKAGLTVHEYRPLEKRSPEVESAMEKITAEWLAGKKSGLLTFTMGTMGLANPMDRRYFYADDIEGHIWGYSVFCPYDGGKGYMADITRRGQGAPGGITEKIMYEAMQVFRAEGVQSVSLGIAPLANLVKEGEPASMPERLLQFVYEHLNACYGFKALYRAKENYSPTQWVPGYYAWLPKIPSPAMFYAMVRIQNRQGIWDFVRAYWKARGQKTPPPAD